MSKANSMEKEFSRISQFETEADGDEDKFRQKVLLRAARSSNDKKQRFVDALRLKGYSTLATFIDSLMVTKDSDD